jgi:hypothetical protein
VAEPPHVAPPDHRANLPLNLHAPDAEEHLVKRRLVALAVAGSLLGLAPAAAPVSGPFAPAAAVAKTCSSSYTHAVIGGAQKCLRRGQYCARARDREYHRYGFHCHKRDAQGSYRLT